MLLYQSARHASRGARRYQEDAAQVWPLAPTPDGAGQPERLLAVLADGMGGHAGGAIASRTVCESFLAAVAQSAAGSRERLMAGLDAANAAIAHQVAGDPKLSGMGSTLIGALFGPQGLEWVSVGDSPLYLYRNGEIALLNEDHSLAPALDQMAAEGRLTLDQARSDPRRHLLRSAVVGEDLDMIDLSRQALELRPGDCVVLASDGINTLETEEIARVVGGYLGDGCGAVAEALVRAVEQIRDPHQDNVTVIVVKPLESDA
ncbi:MAG: serine/threonine-protein phosphatase [Hyphomicrobiaceae bacterium]|nr:serine/threonine-protein phosphatase [Hyphomicrobiaceae bacterium]